MNSIRALLLLAVLILSFPSAAASATVPPSDDIVWFGAETGIVGYSKSRILVLPKKGVSPADLNPLHEQAGSVVHKTLECGGNIQIVQVQKGADVTEVAALYRHSPLVEMVSLDYLFKDINASEPNDPYYTDGTLWALNNTGQNGGKPDADIDAPEAWDVQPNAQVVTVAVVDGGVRYTHEDLADTMWTNTHEDLNHNQRFEKWPSTEARDGVTGDLDGVDNDSNGYVDDVIGWDFATYNNNVPDNDPFEYSLTYSHGTECSGIVAAIANNGKGTVGVAPGARIMAIRKSNDNYSYWSDHLSGLNYAVMMGSNIISDSSGISPHFYDTCIFCDPNELNLIDPILATARERGIIVVVAAANAAQDLADDGWVPAVKSALFDNVVTVAATDRWDRMAWYSNYSTRYVQIAAPAVDTWSCTSSADNAYGPFGGTSSATPHVSGALALLKAAYPTESYRKLIGRLLSGADPSPFLDEICSSGGRLNAFNALTNPRNDLRVMPVSGIELAYSDPTVAPSSRTKTYTLWNDGDAALAWSATTGDAWFSVTPSSGSLTPGAKTVVSVAFNDGVRLLSPGPHRSTVVFDTAQGAVSRDVVVNPGVMHVRPDGNDDSDGSTWALAKKSIQAAVDASMRDQEIWVAGGTYTENVEIGRGVALFGGFSGTETSRDQRNWNVHPTVIDGSHKESCVFAPVRTVSLVIIDGFILRNGAGYNITMSGSQGPWGGGACAWGCPLTVRNCVVRDNACTYGGGLFAGFSKYPSLVANNLFLNNTASTGGAFRCQEATLSVLNNTFTGNSATSPTGEYGGAMRILLNTTGLIANNIIVRNSSGIHVAGDGISVTLKNNDVWGNTAYQYTGVTATNDISVDPLFVEAANGNYRLQPNSPCVDAGTNDVAGLPSTDLDGDLRIRNGTVDIGAYECASGYSTSDIVDALRVASGLKSCTVAEIDRLNVEKSAGSVGTVDILDAVRLARMLADLDTPVVTVAISPATLSGLSNAGPNQRRPRILDSTASPTGKVIGFFEPISYVEFPFSIAKAGMYSAHLVYGTPNSGVTSSVSIGRQDGSFHWTSEDLSLVATGAYGTLVPGPATGGTPLQTGDYIIRVQNISHTHSTTHVQVYEWNDGACFDIGQIVLTRTGVLPEFGAVTGQVTSPDMGIPVAGALVTANPTGAEVPEPGPFWKRGWWTTTDANGTYQLSVPPGTYTVQAGQPSMYALAGGRAQGVTVTETGASTTDINLQSRWMNDTVRVEAEYYTQKNPDDWNNDVTGIALLPVSEGSNGYKLGWIDAGDWVDVPVDVPEGKGGLYTLTSYYTNGGATGTVSFMTDHGDMVQDTQPALGWGTATSKVFTSKIRLYSGHNVIRQRLESGNSDFDAFGLTLSEVLPD